MNLITPDRVYLEPEFDVTQPYNAGGPCCMRFSWDGITATDMGVVNLDPVPASVGLTTRPSPVGAVSASHTVSVSGLKASTVYYYVVSNINSTDISASDQSALLSYLTPPDPAQVFLQGLTVTPNKIKPGQSTKLSVQTRIGATAASGAIVKFYLPDATLGNLKVRNGASGSTVLVVADPTVLETVTFTAANPFPQTRPYKVNIGITVVGSGCAGAPAPAGVQTLTAVVTVD